MKSMLKEYGSEAAKQNSNEKKPWSSFAIDDLSHF